MALWHLLIMRFCFNTLPLDVVSLCFLLSGRADAMAPRFSGIYAYIYMCVCIYAIYLLRNNNL